MRIFVSYARRDREAVDVLLQDMRRARHDVWVDEELTGGQAWWDTILATIRTTDVFVVALSPDLLRSRACAAEYEYAVGCQRTVLPIMVARVSPQMAPPAIANAQILDYVERTPNAAISLVTALSAAVPSPALPDPLPPPPPVPMSYMNTYRERLDELSLNLQQQSLLFSELRVHLNDDDDREIAIELIRRLRTRGDITESVGKEIDALLASLPAATATSRPAWGVPDSGSTPPSTSSGATSSESAPMSGAGSGAMVQPVASDAGSATGATSPAAWQPDPYRRYELRYWDGSAWTEHVSSGGRRSVDQPTATATSAQTTGAAVAPFSTTNYVLLILASVFCFGIVGIIVGAINLKHPARKSQAQVLLIVGIASVVLGALVAAGS